MKLLKTITLVFLVTTTTHAQIWMLGGKKIVGNGNILRTEISLPNFNEIQISGALRVITDSGLKNDIIVESESNLLPYLTTRVSKNKTLFLKTPIVNRIVPSKGNYITIYIPWRALSAITLSGTGSLQADQPITAETISLLLRGSGTIRATINAQEVQGKISGSGNMLLSGIADRAEFSIRGTGAIEVNELATQRGTLKMSGQASATVNHMEQFAITKRGNGRIILTEKEQ